MLFTLLCLCLWTFLITCLPIAYKILQHYSTSKQWLIKCIIFILKIMISGHCHLTDLVEDGCRSTLVLPSVCAMRSDLLVSWLSLPGLGISPSMSELVSPPVHALACPRTENHEAWPSQRWAKIHQTIKGTKCIIQSTKYCTSQTKMLINPWKLIDTICVKKHP